MAGISATRTLPRCLPAGPRPLALPAAGWRRHTSGRAGKSAAQGSIQQSAYLDAYGAPILTPNTAYRFRAWVKVVAATVTATISSASAGFSATATLTGTTNGAFSDAAFSLPMPATIPADMILSIGQGAGLALVDEISIIYAQTPYLDTLLYGSYVDNPEAFDGVTGKFGASQDTRKVMDFAVIRQTMNILTQDPSGRLHQTSDNGVTEPAGWQVNEIAANCGLLSAFALTKSQADDSSGSGGEEWIAWASSSGARIFGGGNPDKISQEIQPDWIGAGPAGAPWSGAPGITASLQITAWVLNDPTARVIYFGLPVAPIPFPGPSRIYAMNYRELDTAAQIAASGPIRTSYTGKLIATDHTRKWAPWNVAANGAALMYRAAGVLSPVLFSGWISSSPGVYAGTGNVYTLDPAMLTDDDYGQIFPIYTTYFFVTHDQEQALAWHDGQGKPHPLGAGRKLLQYLAAYASGTGNLGITFLCNSLANPWPLTVTRALVANPTTDLECGGGSAIGNRIAVQFASSPVAMATDNGFNLQKVMVWMKAAVHLPIRGTV